MTTVSAESAGASYLLWLICHCLHLLLGGPLCPDMNGLAILAAEICRDRLRHRVGSMIVL